MHEVSVAIYIEGRYGNMEDDIRLRVVEHFISINGEGRRAGQLALFIRFAGWNLNCEYCDTKWANDKDVDAVSYTLRELLALIHDSGVKNVTLTGGEPLLQPGMDKLLGRLRENPELRVEIETNGSVDIQPFWCGASGDNVSFTLDYKTSASGMEQCMCLTNYSLADQKDTVKFVVGCHEDLEGCRQIIEQYRLREKGCGVYISPCFGEIEPSEIVDYIVAHRMNDVNVQLQLHKYIWNPDARGV